jgi:uncharacterized protein YcfJ
MKNPLIIMVLCCLPAIAFAVPAEARPGGCIKGAIVGGIAGHFVGHGGIGAGAGCAYGMHRRNEYDRQQHETGRSAYAPNESRRQQRQ